MIWRFLQIIVIVLRHIPRGFEPTNIREFFEDCGGAWVKLGQMLALRSDLLPEAVALELTQLFESLPPSAIDESIANSFAYFEHEPIAVASFAQVHRAQMPDGALVAVKIQKDIASIISADLKILKFFASIGDFLFRFPTPLKKVVKEFTEWTTKELDYTQEAQATEMFQTMKLAGVKSPTIIWSHTSKNILTENLVEGLSLSRILQNPVGYDTKYLAQKLIDTTIRQYYFYGYFHADPHAGNILVDADHTLWYVDFGITGSASLEHRSGMAQFIVYALQGKYDPSIDAFLRLGFMQQLLRDLHYLKHPKLQSYIENGIYTLKKQSAKKLKEIVENWQSALANPDATFQGKSAAVTFLKFINYIGKYRVSLDSSLMLFIKTLVAVDAICLRLDPSFNLAKVTLATLARPEYQMLFTDDYTMPSYQNGFSAEKTSQLQDYYTEWLLQLKHQI